MSVEERLRNVELTLARLTEEIRGMREDLTDFKRDVSKRVVYLERSHTELAQRVSSIEPSRRSLWLLITSIITILGLVIGILVERYG